MRTISDLRALRRLARMGGVAREALRRLEMLGVLYDGIDLLAGIHRMDIGDGQSRGQFAHRGGSSREGSIDHTPYSSAA